MDQIFASSRKNRLRQMSVITHDGINTIGMVCRFLRRTTLRQYAPRVPSLRYRYENGVPIVAERDIIIDPELSLDIEQSCRMTYAT